MGKVIEAIDLKSIGAVNGLVSTLKKRQGRKKYRKNPPLAWDNQCWPLFQEGKNGIQTALALGYKRRNQSVEASLKRFKAHNGIPMRGGIILPKPVQEDKPDEIKLHLRNRFAALFEHISLAEIMRELGPMQRKSLFDFVETLCEGIAREWDYTTTKPERACECESNENPCLF